MVRLTDVLARTGQIMARGTKDFFVENTDYLTNISALVNDANTVKQGILGNVKTARETFDGYKSGGIVKKASDWFWDRSVETDDYSFDSEDEFNPGYDTSTDEDGETHEKPSLNYGDMKDIAKGHVNAMYKIGGKQAEVNIANTAEIVNTINSRSSEIIASINNTNATLIGISKKMDVLITNMVAQQEKPTRYEANPLYDYNGRMSLTSIYNAASESIKNNTAVSILGSLKSLGSMGGLNPEGVLSILLANFLGDRKFKFLGNNSIVDIGTKVNDTIGAITDRLMDKIVDNKGFQKIFGNLRETESNVNFQRFVPNQYNTKPAVFDGMVRTSIVSVIPDYLKEILNVVSKGQRNLSVNERGNLTSRSVDGFSTAIQQSFGTQSAMKHEITYGVAKKNQLSSRDTYYANKILSWNFIYAMYRFGVSSISENDLNPASHIYQYATQASIEAMSQLRGGSVEHWENIVNLLMMEVQSDMVKSNGFIREINRLYNEGIAKMKNAAASGKNTSTFSTIDQQRSMELMTTMTKNSFGADFNLNNQQQPFGSGDKQVINIYGRGDDDGIQLEDNTKILKSIANILNRGINVHNTGKKAFKPVDLSNTTITIGNNYDISEIQEVDPEEQKKLDAINAKAEANKQLKDLMKTLDMSDLKEFGSDIMGVLGEGGRHIRNSVTMDGVPTGASNMIDKATGAVKGAYGKVRNSSFVNSAIDSGKSMFSGAKDFVTDKRDSFMNKFDNWMDVRDFNRAQKGYQDAIKWSKDNADEISQSDIQIANMVNALMQTALTTGENASQEEINNVQKAINKIQNAKLRSQLSTTVIPMMRNASVAQKAGESNGGGGLLSKILGGVKTLLKPLNLIKIAITGLFNLSRQLFLRVFSKDVEHLKELGGEFRSTYSEYREARREYRDAKREERQMDPLEYSRQWNQVSGAIRGRTAEVNARESMLSSEGNMRSMYAGDRYGNATTSRLRYNAFTGQYEEDQRDINARNRIDTRANFMSGIRGTSDAYTNTKSAAYKAGNVVRGTYSAAETIAGIPQKLADKIEKSTSQSSNAVTKYFKKLGKNADNTAKSTTSFLHKLSENTSDKMGNILNKFGNTTFGRRIGQGVGAIQDRFAVLKAGIGEGLAGFKEGLKGKPEAKMDETNFVDVKMNDLSEAITGANAADEKTSIFGKIYTSLTGFFDKYNEDKETEKQQAQQTDEQTNNTEGTTSVVNDDSASVKGETTTTTTTTTTSGDTNGGVESVNTESESSGDGGNEGGDNSGVLGEVGNAVGEAAKGMKSMSALFKMGKSLGKLVKIATSIWGVVGKIALKIFATFAGFKALKKTFNAFKNTIFKVLKKGLAPLGKLFEFANKILKPIFKELSRGLDKLMQGVSKILDSLIKAIVPILESLVEPLMDAISPTLDSILGILEPLFDTFSSLVTVIMVPIAGYIKKFIVPHIQLMADVLQITMGILKIGFGNLMSVIGLAVQGIGHIASILGSGDSLVDAGEEAYKTGRDLNKEGFDDIKTGASNYVTHLGDYYSNLLAPVDISSEDDNETKGEFKSDREHTYGSIMEGNVETTGSGDTYNNTNIYNTYGSGNTRSQRDYGNALGMKDNGCGPTALADAYNRRTGRNVDSLSLATSMAGNGSYNPNKGTSIGSFLSTSSQMGMGLKPGGVTANSLKSASPTNPITVLGSGSEFGTRKGNNHYVNVIGSDSHGGTYVSNPLTGRVDRRSTSALVGSSVMGLYGSGDSGITLPDAVSEAFSELKSITSDFLGLFTGPSAAETLEYDVNSVGNESIKKDTKNMIERFIDQGKLDKTSYKSKYDGNRYEGYDASVAQAKDMAWEDYQSTHEKKWNQSEKAYKDEFEKWYNENRQTSYLGKVISLEDIEKMTNETGKSMTSSLSKISSTLFGEYNAESGGWIGGFGEEFTNKLRSEIEQMKAQNSSTSSGSSAVGGSFASESGSPLYTNYTVESGDTNIDGHESYNSPLHEFFAKMAGGIFGDVYSTDENWYEKRANPNAEGVGQNDTSTGPHGGVDFVWHTGSDGKPLYATTGGVVVKSDKSNSAGYNIRWKDDSGFYHWYMHMKEPPQKKKGDTINGGDLLGYVGNTGASQGSHLHYSINSTQGANSREYAINPLTYFKRRGSSGLRGSNNEEQIYAYLTDNGLTPAAAAGLMGNFVKESSLYANNLENGYENFIGISDEEFTNRVDNGIISKSKFISDPSYTRYSGGRYGYGIAQFTDQSHKQNLYERTVEKGRSIGSLEDQLAYVLEGVNSRGILSDLNNASPEKAALIFHNKYEGSADDATKIAGRTKAALDYYSKYHDVNTSGWTKADGSASIITGTIQGNQTPGNPTPIGSGKVNSKVETHLNVRDNPSMDGRILTTLQSGTSLQILDNSNPNWLLVSTGGNTKGYVSAEYVDQFTTKNLVNSIGTSISNSAANVVGNITGSGDIPPLDQNAFNGIDTIVSNIGADTDRVRQILDNTFNVHDEQVAELLKQIIELLNEMNDGDDDTSGTSGGTSTSSQRLFGSDDIPLAIRKLVHG